MITKEVLAVLQVFCGSPCGSNGSLGGCSGH